MNKRCAKQFELGCKMAKIQQFCRQGHDDLVAGRISNCKPIGKDNAHFGHEFYELCCKVCVKGMQAYQSGGSCELPDQKTDVSPKQDKLFAYIKQLYVDCCTDIPFSGLKSNEFEETDLDWKYFDLQPRPFRDDRCANLGCEYMCDENLGEVYCVCEDGYELTGDGVTCQDINECAEPDSMDLCPEGRVCVNVQGGFNCEIKPPVKDLPRPPVKDSPVKDRPSAARQLLGFDFCALLLICLASFLAKKSSV